MILSASIFGWLCAAPWVLLTIASFLFGLLCFIAGMTKSDSDTGCVGIIFIVFSLASAGTFAALLLLGKAI